MAKEIKTILSSEKEITSDADSFYKNYWTEDEKIKPLNFEKNKKIIDHFFPGEIQKKVSWK